MYGVLFEAREPLAICRDLANFVNRQCIGKRVIASCCFSRSCRKSYNPQFAQAVCPFACGELGRNLQAVGNRVASTRCLQMKTSGSLIVLQVVNLKGLGFCIQGASSDIPGPLILESGPIRLNPSSTP